MNIRTAQQRCYHALCTLALALACAFGCVQAAGVAEPAKVDLKIAGQPLDEALQEFARQSGIQIIYFSRVTEGLTAPALGGRYTIPAALGVLLAGSKLTFRVVNASTIEIKPLPADAAPDKARDRAVLAGNKRMGRDRSASRAKKKAEKPSGMEEVVINGTAEGLVATRTETPLREIPQSVSIISREQIRQQNDTDLAHALTHATGITAVQTNSLNQIFYSRGFGITTFHLDGGPALNSFDGSAIAIYGTPDLGEFDHIEVLRGADGLFGANANPGATVNLVRKRPGNTYDLRFDVLAGSWNNYRVETDVTGPLGFDGALRGRLDGVYLDRDYFFNTATLSKKKVFGVVELDIGSQGLLTVGGSYEWSNALPFADGLPRNLDGSDAHLPRDTSFTFDWAQYDTRTRELYTQFEQRFASDWKVKVNATALRRSADYAFGSFGSEVNPATGGLSLRPTAVFTDHPEVQHQYAVDATVTGAFELFGHRGNLAIGADYASFKGDISLGLVESFGGVLNDVYAFDPAAWPDPRLTPTPSSGALDTSKQSGVFGSVRVYLTDAFSTVLGARVSRDSNARQVFLNVFGLSASIKLAARNTDKVTPYAGLIYNLSDHYSLYASYADIYLSNGGVTAVNGEYVPPADGVNIEAGIKGVWREGALNGMLALYDINQHGLAENDNEAPLSARLGGTRCCYKQGGYNRSKGVDTELSGEVMPGWLIGTGYTYNVNRAGNGPELSSSTPRHLFKLWTSAELPGAANRFTLGGSVHAQSGNFVQGIHCPVRGENNSCIPGHIESFRSEQGFFFVVDLRAGYEIGPRWRAALSLNNVFDRVYYDTIGTPNGANWYGEPRNVLLRVEGHY